MIEKLISLKNIGRFRDAGSAGDVAFRKLTLIFAENGQGKTTLCAILRSLQSGQPEFISERKTLGAIGKESVQIRCNGSTISFANGTWSTTQPNITIFDSAFIHENIYAGDYIDHEHKKNLYRVIVGTQGVHLAKEIEELDSKIRAVNRDIETKRSAILKTMPADVGIDVYLYWQPVEDIENKIRQKFVEMSNRQHALAKASEIQSKALFAKISLPEFPSNFLTILAKQLSDISADAESRVKQQIAKHHMGDQGESWLSMGLNYIANDQCPFCEQDISINELIKAYQSHFNAAYKALKREVTLLSTQVDNTIGDSSLSAKQQIISKNLTLAEFWKQFTDIELPDFNFDEIREKYSLLLKRASALAQRKQQTPTEAVIPDADFNACLEDVKTLQKSVEMYNKTIEVCNARIDKQKTAVSQDDYITNLKKEFTNLEARKERFEPEVIQACQTYHDVLALKNLFENQKETAKQKLNDYCNNILETFENTINMHLDQFNAGFRIVNSRHLYTGGTPSSNYQILINNTALNLGDARTQSGTPCFKTTLSAGDRSALALAFFLSAIKQDQQIADKIVVLDDPFTSLDHFRRECTQQLIRQIAGIARQVIVLSHDLHFLKLIWDGYSPAEIKVLQLCRNGDNTWIGECDIETKTQSSYIMNYSTLLSFYRQRVGNPLDVARSIRPFLEGWLRGHFPGRFKPSEWLGQFIEKIKAADETDGFQHAKADISEIEAINDYSKKYHHEQNPNANSEPLSTEELHGFVKRTLRLVGGVRS